MAVVIPPLGEGSDNIVFYPDELPVGTLNVDIVDVLRGELAPLSVWRECAVSLWCLGGGDWPVRLICALLT